MLLMVTSGIGSRLVTMGSKSKHATFEFKLSTILSKQSEIQSSSFLRLCLAFVSDPSFLVCPRQLAEESFH